MISLARNKSAKSVDEGTAINTLYFTNRCNLACTYCYEVLDGRPKQVMTQQQIMDNIKTVIDREPRHLQTLFILFGGEPLLEWENVQFAMDYAYSLKKNVKFLMITNGLRLLEREVLLSLVNNKFYKDGSLVIEISYDGVGNGERIYKNGKASEDNVLKVFNLLKTNNFPFRIRYTINKANYTFFKDDMLALIDIYKPERLVTSATYSEFTDEELEQISKTRDELVFMWNQQQVTTPICEFFCDACNGCSASKENKSYFSTEGNVKNINNFENQDGFSHFKEKE